MVHGVMSQCVLLKNVLVSERDTEVQVGQIWSSMPQERQIVSNEILSLRRVDEIVLYT